MQHSTPRTAESQRHHICSLADLQPYWPQCTRRPLRVHAWGAGKFKKCLVTVPEMIRRRIWILLLLLFAASTGWLVRQLDTSSVDKNRALVKSPDYYIEDFHMTTMDQQGQPERRLEAEYMEHYPNTDIKTLQSAYLVMYQPTSPAWHVRASRARVSGDHQVIDLFGEVQIWREGTSGSRELEIETEDLTVYTKAHYGETLKPVVIRTPHSESHGTGMQAYLDEGRLILKSQVRTRYEALHP
jgi:lipopolysaccharide export system protein LptC